MKQYLFNILISVDQMINTLLAGNPDETISSRMGKLNRAGKCKPCTFICKILSRFDKRHCFNSIEDDEV